MLKALFRIILGKTEKQSCATSGDFHECHEEGTSVIQGYEYRATLDNFCCPECWPLDGQIFPKDETLRPLVPRHDGCRCGYLPKIPTYRELGLDLDDLDDVKRPWTIRDTRTTYKNNPSKKLKNPPRTILQNGFIQGTAEDWIKTLPVDLQRGFFKTELAYELWASKKIKGSDLINPLTWELRTDEELSELIK